MRFQVPQFIDVEDKIFGPLTLKQFIYVAGGASITLVTTTFFGVFLGIIIASPILLRSLALAFYKIKSLIVVIGGMFSYFSKGGKTNLEAWG